MIPSREAATIWPPPGLKATSVMTSGPHVSSLWSQLVTCRVSYTYTCPSSAPVARCLMQGLRAGLHWCLSSWCHYHYHHHSSLTWCAHSLGCHISGHTPGLSSSGPTSSPRHSEPRWWRGHTQPQGGTRRCCPGSWIINGSQVIRFGKLLISPHSAGWSVSSGSDTGKTDERPKVG